LPEQEHKPQALSVVLEAAAALAAAVLLVQEGLEQGDKETLAVQQTYLEVTPLAAVVEVLPMVLTLQQVSLEMAAQEHLIPTRGLR
jgi:hypothetical protein